MDLLKEISRNVEEGDDDKVFDLTKEAINNNISPREILHSGLLEGMNIVGIQFKANEIFLPDVLMAARAMYAGLDQLKPLLIKDGVPSRGKIVLGTVEGDMHDIGRNLVGIMLNGAGFEVIDLGCEIPPAKFIEAALEHNAKLIGMSALLTTTMPVMKEVIDLLKEKDLYGKIKTIVGGAPVSKEFAQEIGADKYSYDASHAVETVKELLQVQ